MWLSQEMEVKEGEVTFPRSWTPLQFWSKVCPPTTPQNHVEQLGQSWAHVQAQSLHPLVPPFPHVYDRDNNAFLIELLWGLNEIIYVNWWRVFALIRGLLHFEIHPAPKRAQCEVTMARVHNLIYWKKRILLCFSKAHHPGSLLTISQTGLISVTSQAPFQNSLHSLLQFKPPKVSSEKNLAQVGKNRRLKSQPVSRALLLGCDHKLRLVMSQSETFPGGTQIGRHRAAEVRERGQPPTKQTVDGAGGGGGPQYMAGGRKSKRGTKTQKKNSYGFP